MFRIVPIFVAVLLVISSTAEAQRRPIHIGGPNGLTMGGGMGFMLGGRNGVHFGGGQGARFGPPELGMHFGGGQGARFGTPNFGMHFGGGRGAHFGGPNFGMQFGGGNGVQIGPINPPVYGQGNIYVQPQTYYSNPAFQPAPTIIQPAPGQIIQPIPEIPSETVIPSTLPAPIEPIQNNVTPPVANPTPAHSILERTSDKKNK